MQEEWWESPACWLCNHWWRLLILVILLLSAYFTRELWYPALGLSIEDGLEDVRVSQREIALNLKDNGNVIDGDRIQLTLNGKMILEDHTLTETGTLVSLGLRRGSNQVVIIALEGYSNPNTVEVSITNVIEGQPVQVSDGLETGQKAEFTIRAPWW